MAEANELEQALESAGGDPSKRGEVTPVLLRSTIYVLGTADTPLGEAQTVPAGSSIDLHQWQMTDGSSWIPCFSSMEAATQLAGSDQPVMAMPAQSLLGLARGWNICLNPMGATAMPFPADEVENLLAAATGSADREEVAEETKVQLGQPASVPAGLTESLTALFREWPQVDKAHLAQVQEMGSAGGRSYMLVGIEATGDAEAVVDQASELAKGTLAEGERLGVYQIDPAQRTRFDSSLASYGQTIYQAGWVQRLKGIFGNKK